MRSLATQIGLSLAVLFAWPLLGGGSQAQGSFLVRTPACSATESGMMDGTTAAEPESNQQRRPDIHTRYTDVDALLLAGLPHSGAGTAGAAAGASNASSIVQAVVPMTQVNLAPLQVVRGLYFEDVRFRSPPFASRLFRPPRVA
jgi:hypothetical protein